MSTSRLRNWLPLVLTGSLFLISIWLSQKETWALRALWPTVAALTTVLVLRNALFGLLTGALCGSLILAGGAPMAALLALLRDHFFPHFSSSWKVGAIAFTFVLGGFVAIIERGGGLYKLLRTGSRETDPGDAARGFLWSAYGMGWLCFFDGLANSLMLGRMLRSIAGVCGVSRVKLAYLVDSTSSAVACIAFVSTWIAYQLSMIQEGYNLAGRANEANPYGLFFASIPMNFYCWFTLGLLALSIGFRWDIGPMRRFERMARQNQGEASTSPTEETVRHKGPLWSALLPILFLILAIIAGIYASGMAQMGEPLLPFDWKKVSLAFAEAETPVVLILSSLGASVLAMALFPSAALGQRESRWGVFESGMSSLFAPILILLAAWMLSSTLEALGAGAALAGLVSERLPVELLPAAVFLLGAAISFSTGTSWGTMGILMPLSIPLGFELSTQAGIDPAAINHLMATIVAAVFSGAVFGDHCSPISDTTIVASIASGVDPIDHVKTQMPFALVAAAAALLLGFLPSIYLPVPGLGLGLGMAGLAAVVYGTREQTATSAIIKDTETNG